MPEQNTNVTLQVISHFSVVYVQEIIHFDNYYFNLNISIKKIAFMKTIATFFLY